MLRTGVVTSVEDKVVARVGDRAVARLGTGL